MLSIIEIFRRQSSVPSVEKLSLICNLIRLNATRNIASMAAALVMNDLGEGLVHCFIARSPDAQSEISVLAVGGHKKKVKAVKALPQGPWNRYRCARAVINILHVIKLGKARVLIPSEVPSGRISPQDSTRLLQCAIRIEKLGSNKTNLFERFEGTD